VEYNIKCKYLKKGVCLLAKIFFKPTTHCRRTVRQYGCTMCFLAQLQRAAKESPSEELNRGVSGSLHVGFVSTTPPSNVHSVESCFSCMLPSLMYFLCIFFFRLIQIAVFWSSVMTYHMTKIGNSQRKD